ncbi:hypothetical protein [Seonamhaeicola sp.]|uniref:hypothetical protein n=1 Tax=Seonamhaeicola sp. TaxID=1912245 RepID=UPI0026276100|nr:hypothetical protein [Seonamhaeicola sp.]
MVLASLKGIRKTGGWLLVIIVLIVLQSCYDHEDDLISQGCETGCAEVIGKLMTDNGTVPIKKKKYEKSAYNW